MPSLEKKKLMKIFTSGGCRCGPKATDIIEPEPKPKTTVSDQKPSICSSSSASSWDGRGGGKSAADEEDNTSTTFSLTIDVSPQNCPENHGHAKAVSPCPKLRDSLAVTKDSDDPYKDFRHSMLQMIFEKEIYSRQDLQQLLDCFLKLNSHHHHAVIVKAFMEIWNGIVPDSAGLKEEAPPCSSA